MQERGAHGVHFPIAAIDGDGADDHKLKVLLLDGLHDLAELKDGPRKPADLAHDQGGASFDVLQQEIQLRLHLGVAVFALGDDFFSACGLQLARLSKTGLREI